MNRNLTRFIQLCSLFLLLFLIDTLGSSQLSVQAAQTVNLPNPILFVTQVPIPVDFTTVGATLGNHVPDLQQAGRGGDLWIRYPDGTLKNLTETAGYGYSGFQGLDSIAVRDPHVHWDGQKALFSIAMHATTEQYEWETYFWQMYEITGLGLNDTPVIT
ncbi:MAG: hypothetical protein KAG66_21245, partial [Methylococcales bacterium]|nr:hypothetical protein [Methylococcales bacterium]